MSIKIKLYESELQSETDQKSYYARIVEKDIISFETVCEVISQRSTLSTADIKGTIDSLAYILNMAFLDGDGVQLGQLGTFLPSLQGKAITDKKKLPQHHFRINGIHVHPGKEFYKAMIGAKFVRLKEDEKISTIDERKRNIMQYLTIHSEAELLEISGLNRCSRSTALRDLNLLLKEGHLRKRVFGGGSLYSKV